MRFSPFKIYCLKVGVFSTVLLYLGIDLFAWHGPVWHAVYDGTKAKEAIANAPASVYGEAITEDQLARHTAEQDLLAGRAKPEPIRRASRLLELVRATDLRTRTRYNDLNLPPRRQEAEAEAKRLEARAGSKLAFFTALYSQGYTVAGFTDKIEARLRAQALVERAIAPHCTVDDATLAALYEDMKDELILPPSRHVSHIFLETLHKDPAAVKAKAEALLQRAQAGEDFAKLAQENSEDLHSAPKGGDLGDIRDTPERTLPELPLFGADAIPAGTPVMVQSAWGWHILLAGDIQPARQATLEESKETLRSAYISAQRDLAAQQFYDQAVKDDRRKKHIEIHVK